ncbi:MAG: hypothetical protein GF383_13415 [Candidatus Lokiarchaeota archaeon]|nr:hypothetical protein [Candidatus Lokiarchaeota archaeon]MBD3342196.1 hypothetical protein [Candidatus Lokiarchaeota archaeon]
MKENLEIYQEYGKRFEELLRPHTFPIAIKLLENESDIPKNCRRPLKHLKVSNFICQNFSMVRRYGWTIAVTEEDCVCKLARFVYGWDNLSDEIAEWGHKFNIGLYSRDLKTSKKLDECLFLFHNKFKGIVVSPLTRTKIIPDIVQIYGLPAQIMRLTQAYLYMKGGMLQFTDAGRIGSCHIGVIKTFQTREPQLVILGNGDRVWGGAEDHEVMFSIPKDLLAEIIQGLEETHKGGLRYPIPKYMNYKPGFQSSFKKMADRRAGGTLVKEK